MKVDAAVEYTYDLVQQGRPVVLFHYHMDDKGRPVEEGEPSGIYARLLDKLNRRGIECSSGQRQGGHWQAAAPGGRCVPGW